MVLQVISLGNINFWGLKMTFHVVLTSYLAPFKWLSLLPPEVHKRYHCICLGCQLIVWALESHLLCVNTTISTNNVTLGKLISQNFTFSIYKIESARIQPHLIIVSLIWGKWYNILSIAPGIVLDLWRFLFVMAFFFFMLSTGQMQKYNEDSFELII